MDTAIRAAFDTLSLTSILVLLVLGMSVIVSMMRVFNLCHGELVLLGAACSLLSQRWFGSALVGMFLAPLVVGVIGFVLERTIVSRFTGRPAGALLATFAIGLIIREITRARMTVQALSVKPPIDGTFAVGGALLSTWRLVLIIAVLFILGGCWLLVSRTNIGLRVRATLDNPGLAEAAGIPTRLVYSGTYAFGAALAGLAGALIVPVQTFYPDLGVQYLVRSFIAVMLGGIGTFLGPIFGAGTIGVASGLLPLWIDGYLSDVIIIIAAIVVMRVRPAGLFTRTRPR
jgi:branched-chain amino acid transport system permease protein